MASIFARDRASTFYARLAVFALLVMIAGFSTTYFLPMARGSFSAPPVVHLHGTAAFSWLILLLSQALLVRQGNVALHRNLGLVAVPLAVVVWGSGILTAHWAALRDVPSQGSTATAALGATATGLTLFLLPVIAAILLRRRPDWHKRLLVLATIQLIWPGFFRLRHLLPMVPAPEVWLALAAPYSLLLLAALRDRLLFGRVHPVWLFVAPLIVVEQVLEVAFFDQGIHRAWGQWLFALLS